MTLMDLALPYQRKVIQSRSRFKVLNWSRQIGKSWTAGFLSSRKCLSRPNALVLYLSTGLRAANEALKTCNKFAEAISKLTHGQIKYSSSASTITFSNGSRIMSLPGNPASARGWTADLLVMDELAFIQHAEELWSAVVPTLTNPLAQVQRELVVCSTPFGKNSIFYELCQKANSTEDWAYFETTIHDAISDGLKVDLNALKTLVPDPMQFQQEFECQFLDAANALIDPSLLQFQNQMEEYDEHFIGMDIARTSDGTQIAVIGRNRNTGKMGLVEVVSLHNVPYAQQVAVAKSTFRKWKNVRLFYGDSTGLGGPVMEELNTKVSTLIRPFVFTHKSKNECYENFRKQVMDRNVVFSQEWRNQILDDVALVSQVVAEDGQIKYQARRVGNSHADLVSAIILALKAAADSPLSTNQPSITPYASVFGNVGMGWSQFT